MFVLNAENSMSNLYVNIRIGLYHLQITRQWKVNFSVNEAHKGYPKGFFGFYEFFGLI